MNTVNVVVVNEEKDNNNVETLNPLQNAFPLRFHHEFPGNIADEVEETLVERTILSLVGLEFCVVTVVRYCAGQKTSGEHCQKLKAGPLRATLKFAAAQFVGPFCQIVEF